jgi:tetratricopeptide (TPR) repeat protein
MTAQSKERVLDALGVAASKLRAELGESLASVQKFDIPLEQATTTSLEALEAYSKSYARPLSMAEGISYLQRAIELDPNFAMAYANVGAHYADLGELARAKEYYTKAFELRNHASERERLEIAADYYQYVTGELDKAVSILQQSVESYPGPIYLNLGNVDAQLGRYDLAAGTARQYLRLAPDVTAPYVNLAIFSLALQRPDQARDAILAASARHLDIFLFHLNLYGIAFLESNEGSMAEEQKWFAGRPSEPYALALASDTAAYGGRLRQARDLTRRAVDAAIRVDDKENGALWRALAAQREAVYGNAGEAGRWAAEALDLAPDSQAVMSETAIAFALAGDTRRADSLAQELQGRYPLDTQVQSLWLHSIEGQLAIDRNEPDSAIHTLQRALPIELGQTLFTLNISCLYPVYVRGEAYLAAGEGRAAAAEFQKILDHSGIVLNCWTGALAHLGLARAYAMESKSAHAPDEDATRARALAAYQDFLKLWKDADVDIPVESQARAEYARLQ